ncbi:hypothetical protein BS50DRAFT_583629 [Corynespora cassiicola Philippines]|uniref:Uncharacterized protein n=1 Tax=Corynespora cassiicola Philippines TaxID=1448308 RepID=A0A2T2P2Z4_CORCC|nr:hypothetical protein BS50DRAFT_583629 [Corynespora cassiicola Philippines]
MASPQCLSLVPMLPGPAATSLVWRIEVSSGMHWTAVASCSPFHGPDADMTENPSAPSWVSSTWSRLARGSLRHCSFQSTPPLRHQPTAIRPRDPPGRPGSISPPVGSAGRAHHCGEATGTKFRERVAHQLALEALQTSRV